MRKKSRSISTFNIWPSFTDISLSLLLIFLFFLFIQFLANSRVLLKIQMERKQKIIQKAFEAKLGREIRKRVLEVRTDGNLQRFSFSDQILFDVGQASLKAQGEVFLRSVGGILRDYYFFQMEENDELKQMFQSIQINGHTDNSPINTAKFPSNWELSSARAMAVLRLFVDEIGIKPQTLLATGYGEFHPVASNDTETGRQRNRRIEIVLVYSEKQKSD